MSKKWVSNEVADKLVVQVQNELKNNIRSSESILKLMDLISGIDGYDIKNLSRQGIIGKFFNKEIRKPVNNNIPSNFSLSIEDIISTFWSFVFESVPTAKVTGADITLRTVKGQDGSLADRSTNCNPINYLRTRGLTKTRNVITSAYTRNLVQICDKCAASSATNKVEQISPCAKCNSSSSKEIWPDGNSQYRAKKYRQCNDCQNKWVRKFAYACAKCHSLDVHLEARTSGIDETIVQIPGHDELIESSHIHQEIVDELNYIIMEVKKILPHDPQDDTKVTAGMEIFDMMTSPGAHTDICKQCHLSASKVCPEGCKSCLHSKIPDPKSCCGAETFSMDKCINYSKKIAAYHQCSASLTSRRVKKDRQYFIKYVINNKDNIDTCGVLYSMMKQRGILDEFK